MVFLLLILLLIFTFSLTFSVYVCLFERTVVRSGECHYVTSEKLGPKKVLNGPQVEVNRLMETCLKQNSLSIFFF